MPNTLNSFNKYSKETIGKIIETTKQKIITFFSHTFFISLSYLNIVSHIKAMLTREETATAYILIIKYLLTFSFFISSPIKHFMLPPETAKYPMPPIMPVGVNIHYRVTATVCVEIKSVIYSNIRYLICQRITKKRLISSLFFIYY